METLLNLLKGAAPGLATIVAGPLGGAAVTAIANKLGVADTVSAVTEALQSNPEAAQKLAEIDLKQFQLENEDRSSARHMQEVALQQEDWFAKNFLYLFTATWSIFAMTFFAVASFMPVPDNNQRIVDTIIGVLIGTVLTGFFNFFFGSSKGSKDKTDALMKAGK